MLLLGFLPNAYKVAGIVLAIIAAVLLAFDPGDEDIVSGKDGQ
jgi:hypothetical protein